MSELGSTSPRSAADEPETLGVLCFQMSKGAQEALKSAGDKSGVNVLVSRPNRQALCPAAPEIYSKLCKKALELCSSQSKCLGRGFSLAREVAETRNKDLMNYLLTAGHLLFNENMVVNDTTQLCGSSIAA